MKEIISRKREREVASFEIQLREQEVSSFTANIIIVLLRLPAVAFLEIIIIFVLIILKTMFFVFLLQVREAHFYSLLLLLFLSEWKKFLNYKINYSQVFLRTFCLKCRPLLVNNFSFFFIVAGSNHTLSWSCAINKAAAAAENSATFQEF